MGFWSGLVKVAKGKPVFEAPAEGQQNTEHTLASLDSTATPHDSLASRGGGKIIPEVEFEHCKSRVNGSEMEVTAWVTNRSPVIIELDKITMLGLTTELDRVLSPNEGREIRLYKGKAPTSSSDETAYLQYKQRDNGDYFQASFVMEFDYDSDGFYTVEEFRSVNPVKDI